MVGGDGWDDGSRGSSHVTARRVIRKDAPDQWKIYHAARLNSPQNPDSLAISTMGFAYCSRCFRSYKCAIAHLYLEGKPSLERRKRHHSSSQHHPDCPAIVNLVRQLSIVPDGGGLCFLTERGHEHRIQTVFIEPDLPAPKLWYRK